MTTIRIETPEQFVYLLDEPQDAVRHGVWSLLAQQHSEALAYARQAPEATLAALVGQLDPTAQGEESVRLLHALDGLDDARASEEMQRILIYGRDPEALDLAARMLARWDGASRTMLRDCLHDAQRPDLAALAAKYLDPADLPSRERFHQALLRHEAGEVTAGDVPGPSDEGMLEAYRLELAGARADLVRGVAEAHGAPAFEALARLHDRFSEDTRHWLIGWAGRIRTLPALNLLDGQLADADLPRATLLATLNAVRDLGPLATMLAERVASVRDRLANDVRYLGDDTVGNAAEAALAAAMGTVPA